MRTITICADLLLLSMAIPSMAILSMAISHSNVLGDVFSIMGMMMHGRKDNLTSWLVLETLIVMGAHFCTDQVT
jgi:hypothetical protein